MARRYTIQYHNYPLRPAYTAISRVLSTLFHNIYLLVIQFILVFCLVINVTSDVDGGAFVGFLLTLVVPLAAAVLYVVLVWKLEIFVEHMLDKKYETYVRELAEKDPETFAKRVQKYQEKHPVQK